MPPLAKVTQQIADNGLLKLVERVAVPLMVAVVVYIADSLNDVNDRVIHLDKAAVEIRTVQEKVVVPGLAETKASLLVVTDNLLNRPRWDKDDALRQDREHKKIMHGFDERLRAVEQFRSGP